MMRSRCGSAASSVAIAESALRSRRKHMIRWLVIPSVRSHVAQRAPQSVDHGLERDAAIEMRLRVEEDLRVANALRARALQVRGGEIVVVLRRPQHRHSLVVEPQERLEIRELIRVAQRLDVGICEGDAVACRHRRRSFPVRAYPRCGCAVRPSASGRRRSCRFLPQRAEISAAHRDTARVEPFEQGHRVFARRSEQIAKLGGRHRLAAAQVRLDARADLGDLRAAIDASRRPSRARRARGACRTLSGLRRRATRAAPRETTRPRRAGTVARRRAAARRRTTPAVRRSSRA